MTNEDMYKYVIDDLEEFMEELYKEKQDFMSQFNGQALGQVLDNQDEIEGYLKSLTNISENLQNSIFLIKSVAFTRHGIVLYDESEKEFVDDVSRDLFGETVFDVVKKKVS